MDKNLLHINFISFSFNRIIFRLFNYIFNTNIQYASECEVLLYV